MQQFQTERFQLGDYWLSRHKAALNWSWKRGMLESVPHVPTPPKKAAPPRGRPLSEQELVQLLRHTEHQHVLDFIWLMLATGSRPDAIYDLKLSQCDLENRLIHLNPEGRTQTKKYRPTVKMPDCLVVDTENPSERTCLHNSHRSVPIAS